MLLVENLSLTLITIFIAISVILSLSPSRRKKLNSIISDLKNIKKNVSKDKIYAINENILFFESIKTFPGFIIWSLFHRRIIDPKQLLEIADLPLPIWERELYYDLNSLERKSFPGLTKPLKKMILDSIIHKNTSLILDLGCGGMEAERQVIKALKESGAKHNIIFVGVDMAEQAWSSVIENTKELKNSIEVKQIYSLDDISDYRVKKPTILFICADALEIAEKYADKFDLIFSSRFRHHLDHNQKIIIDSITRDIANYSIEYDDYRTAFSWIPPITTAWYKPILLNGAIFSQIRQPSKKELKKDKKNMVHIKFFSPPGSYARIFKQDKVV